MPHIVTDLCIDCKHTSCVSVCPVDCFHEGERILWIDPEECIDCAACVPECPESAIFALEDLPAEYQHCVEENRIQSATHPVIVETKEPLLKADRCKGKEES
jgi:ferredoxin